MSLINDALKRAGQQQGSKPPEGGNTPPPMHPARTPESSPFPFIPVLLFVIFLLAGLFFYLGIRSKKEKELARTNPNPVIAVPTTNASPDSANGMGSSNSKPALPGAGVIASKSRIKISTNIVYRTNIVQEIAAPTNVVPAEVVKTETPVSATNAVAEKPLPEVVLKLQGIFYRQNNPTALINNRTVTKGSMVEGSKVISIEREFVIVEKGGATNVLRMANY